MGCDPLAPDPLAPVYYLALEPSRYDAALLSMIGRSARAKRPPLAGERRRQGPTTNRLPVLDDAPCFLRSLYHCPKIL